MQDIESSELEIIPTSAIESITRGEIDVAIATAHKFPRSMAKFKARAISMATFDEETAASCLYSRPVGKENGKPKYAEGLSIRMAEIVGASYGNLRVGAMIIEQTPRQVKARGVAHDLETNFSATSEVIEATIKRDGSPYDERMRIVIAKAALSKARRDATFMVVPKALCKPVEIECRKVALGDAQTIAKRRGAVVAWISKLGIPMERVWTALGIKGEDDIGLEELATLTGLKTAMKDGEVKVDEAFPPLGENGEHGHAPKFVPPTRGKKEKADKKPYDAPTPVEQVANLIKGSSITPEALFDYVRAMEWGDYNELSEISPELLGQIITNWPKMIASIRQEPEGLL